MFIEPKMRLDREPLGERSFVTRDGYKHNAPGSSYRFALNRLNAYHVINGDDSGRRLEQAVGKAHAAEFRPVHRDANHPSARAGVDAGLLQFALHLLLHLLSLFHHLLNVAHVEPAWNFHRTFSLIFSFDDCERPSARRRPGKNGRQPADQTSGLITSRTP